MNKHIDDVLIEVYSCDVNEVKKMNNDEKEKLLVKKQKEKIQNNKNPNSFFIINGLPAPKKWETKTTTKAGWLVIAAFIIVMLGFLGLFFGLAFSRN